MFITKTIVIRKCSLTLSKKQKDQRQKKLPRFCPHQTEIVPLDFPVVSWKMFHLSQRLQQVPGWCCRWPITFVQWWSFKHYKVFKKKKGFCLRKFHSHSNPTAHEDRKGPHLIKWALGDPPHTGVIKNPVIVSWASWIKGRTSYGLGNYKDVELNRRWTGQLYRWLHCTLFHKNETHYQ